MHTLKTPAQVTSVHWSLTKKEFVTTHGFPTKALMVHSYPSLACVAEIRDAHDTRVLYSSMSPAGDLVCTAAGDDNLKFWRIWEVESIKKKKSFVSEGAAKTTDASILAIR